jgi:hypothetical protein
MPEVKRSHLLFYNICFACCFILATLVFIELVSTVVLQLGFFSHSTAPDYLKADVYKGKPWAAKYWQEHGEAGKFAYQAYVGWRQLPYSGETIKIAADNRRETVNSDCSGKAFTIWMFGGSTMFGTGAPDWGTIPSYLAETLTKAGAPVCVRNLGQTGWRNTQEVMELILELKRSPRPPDLVIFYDGYNEGFAFDQSGLLDVHMNYQQMRDLIEKPSQRRFFGNLLAFLSTTHTFRLITQSRHASSFLDDLNSSSRLGTDEEAKEDLRISYLRNLDVVAALSKQYGFQYAFFCQPTIYSGQKHLSAEEGGYLRRYSSRIEGDPREYRAMAEVLKQGAPDNFVDISDAFDETQDTVYTDFVHVGPEGNKIVATRMFEELQKTGHLPRVVTNGASVAPMSQH